MAEKLSQIEGLYHGYEDRITTWLGESAAAECQSYLNRGKQLLEARSPKELSGALGQINDTLTAKSEEAQSMEEKHEKRLYVLKALRHVCVEMGFEERAPRYEEGLKRGRVVYEVETHINGRIVFYLTLDGISTESEIAEDRCLDKFDALSQQLSDQFGVNTQFRTEDDRPVDRLLQRGEIDLPEGSYQERAS